LSLGLKSNFYGSEKMKVTHQTQNAEQWWGALSSQYWTHISYM